VSDACAIRSTPPASSSPSSRRRRVDHPTLTLGGGGEQHLLDDAGERVGVALDRARQRVAPERAEPHVLDLGHLARVERHAVVVDHDQHATAVDHRSFAAKYSGTIGICSRWMYCHTSSSVQFEIGNTRSVSPGGGGRCRPPQLGPLALRVPLVLRRADREHPLLGPRLLLVATRAAEAQVEAVHVDHLLEALGLPHVGVQRRAVVERVDPLLDALGVLVHDQLHARLRRPGRGSRTSPELPRGVDVHQRERRLRGVEGLRARWSITELSLPTEYSIAGRSLSATRPRA
jgi:hypothetical protein